jgi:pimeloyl-ACP methyl ester carboxylesterase
MGVHVVLAYFKAYGDQYVDSIILFDQPPCCTSREDWPYGRLRGKQDMKKLMDSMAKMFHNLDEFLAEDGMESAPGAFPDIDLPPEMRMNPIEIAFTAEDKSKVPPEYMRILGMLDKGLSSIVDQLALMATWFDSSYQDFRPVVPTIKVPALILAPNPGSVNEFEGTEYYRDNLGGPVTFVELKPGTHYALVEHADLVEKSVIDFLSKL